LLFNDYFTRATVVDDNNCHGSIIFRFSIVLGLEHGVSPKLETKLGVTIVIRIGDDQESLVNAH
jgi:hypothetical protein